MAVLPISGTDIRFLSGVLFSNDYKNTRWFDTATQQYNYFNNRTLVHSEQRATFQRVTGETYIRADKGIDDLITTNYLMFRNGGTNNKWWYAFVTRLEYVQHNRTNVYFELDVLQTWRFDFNFKPSMILREHCKQYNSDGSPVINTVDEGLDYGTDYDIVEVTHYPPSNNIYYLVIISKSMLHDEENKIEASVNGIPQPLCYYVQPFKLTGGVTPTFVGGTDINASSIETILSNIYSHKSSVNNIVSMYVTEHIGYNPAFANAGVNFASGLFEIAKISSDGEEGVENLNLVYVKDITSYEGVTRNTGNKYSGFTYVPESKLRMYPYALTVLTDFKGNQIEIKNEYVSGANLEVHIRGSMGTSNKVNYSVPNYLTHYMGTSFNDKIPVSIENSIINGNPQDVSIINDMLSAYLQGNRNSIENKQNSIIFNGFMNAIGSSVNSLNQASMVNAGAPNPTGVAGAVTGVVGGAGNTVLQLQAIQAKQKDISNVPPSLSKMGGNTAFDFGNDYTGFYIMKKQIRPEYIRKLTDFFRLFGYKVNEVKIPNFHTRKNWNYIQTSNCTITGRFNNEDLQALKSIFDNGITLWHTDNIGNYSLENGEI